MDILARGKIIRASGVREVFTPLLPVQDAELFVGRSAEIASVVGTLDTPGGHALLFGDRGVGKSSLANIALRLAGKLRQAKTISIVCKNHFTFADIMTPALLAAGVNPAIAVTRSSAETFESAKGGAFGMAAEAGSRSGSVDTVVGAREYAGNVGWVAEKIRPLNCVFLLDEVEVLEDAPKAQLAELIKDLSDTASALKLLMTGVARTSLDLMKGHPSVGRCIQETLLRRMSDDEIGEIVGKGGRSQKLARPLFFSSDVVERIILVSCGFPYFAHLLAMNAAEHAVVEDGRVFGWRVRLERLIGKREPITVSFFHLLAGSVGATAQVQGRLAEQYADATRSARAAVSERRKRILMAAAHTGQAEFAAPKVRAHYAELFGEELTQNSLNSHLSAFIRNGSGIWLKTADGVYKFSDPRMPSYIKLLKLQAEARTDATG